MRSLPRASLSGAVSTAIVCILLAAPVGANPAERPDVDPWVHQGGSEPSLTGDGVVIAMLDAPIREDHPAFAEGPGRVRNAANQPADAPTTPEEAGAVGPHGTAVASVAHRIAPGADIVVYSPSRDAYSLTDDPLFFDPFSGYAAAIDQAVADGADIILYSGGLTGATDLIYDQFREVEEAVDRAHDAGVLFITSAGNNGADLLFCGGGADDEDGIVGGLPVGEPLFPVEMEEVFVVGGVQPAGSDGAQQLWDLWDCSLEGDFVDAHAPSVDVEIATLDGDWSTGSGTSYAAPVWAGYAAMLLEYRPDMPLPMLTEMMTSSSSAMSGKSFGARLTGDSYGVPDAEQLDRTIFEIEHDMDAWKVIPQGDRSATSGPHASWCFAVPHDDGPLGVDFEVNLYRSNANSLHVRGLGFQVSTNVPWERGDPTPNFQSITITTPAAEQFDIVNPADGLGCAVSQGEAYAGQERHIYDVLGISRGTEPDGWCAHGAGTYTLTADLGVAGTQNTNFELTDDVLDVLCCDDASSSGGAIGVSAESSGSDSGGAGTDLGSSGADADPAGGAVGDPDNVAGNATGERAETQSDSDDTSSSGSTWPWVGLGGAAAVGAAAFMAQQRRQGPQPDTTGGSS